MNKLTKKSLLVLVITITFLGTVLTSKAQSNNGIDTVNAKVESLKSEIEVFKKLKISGYLQTQFQVADSAGAKSFAGGDFGANIDKRFMVRRGRVKFAYSGNSTQFVAQFDITEKGLSTKDAYIMFTEPFTKWITVKAGVFDRPFGYEISYSSSVRESPERSRLFQSIFPGERDCGASLIIHAPKTSPFNFLKLEAGMFNGAGIASDFDLYKDFIGHLSFNKTIANEKIRIGGGVSYYSGGYTQDSLKRWGDITTVKLVDGTDVKAYQLIYNMNGDINKAGVLAPRRYTGVDFQFSLVTPIGITKLMAEYIYGTNSNVKGDNKAPIAKPADKAVVRNFDGAYVCLVQDIGARNSLVFKYDFYNPNTDISEKDIKDAPAKANQPKDFTKNYLMATSADLKYTTIGLGWIFKFNTNIKMVAYYDIVSNESTGFKSFRTDLKDNVFTLRLQYKF